MAYHKNALVHHDLDLSICCVFVSLGQRLSKWGAELIRISHVSNLLSHTLLLLIETTHAHDFLAAAQVLDNACEEFTGYCSGPTPCSDAAARAREGRQNG